MSVVDTPYGAAMKCDSCGRFFPHQQPGSSWVFVPSSDAPSYEENVEWCRACTEKYGRPLPRQSVNIDMCSGIVAEPETGGEQDG